MKTVELDNCIHSFVLSERKYKVAKQLKERVQIGIDDYGKPIYKWATGYTKQELLMNAAQLLLECGCVKDSGQGRARKHLFRDYAQHWFTVFKEPTVRPLTARNYAQQLKLYLYPTFGEMMVEDITPTDIQKHLTNCQHLAKETQMRQLNVLRMIMDMAVEDGLITLNPVKSKKVHLTNQSRQERQPLTREEMMDAISRIPRVVNPLDRCFIAIQALHAMRPCEVLGLKWEDIDMEKGVLHIRRNVVHPTRNLPVVGDTKTQLSKRAVGISQIALPYIQEAQQTLHRREDFIFGGPSPLSYTQHRKLMYRITKQMGLKGVTGYTFRHTIITDIYELTHDANIASAVAGHSKTTTTMNRYAHARQDAAKRGLEAIDKAYTL